MTLEDLRGKAKFLDTLLDDENAARLAKWTAAITAVALIHDGDHIRQALKWKYRIPAQLWAINLVAVYVLPTVTAFLIKNRRTSAFLSTVATAGITTAGFLKVHLVGSSTNIWGPWGHRYTKLIKGVWHNGQWIQGVDWLSWVLLFDLPAVAIPAIVDILKQRKVFQAQLEAGEEA